MSCRQRSTRHGALPATLERAWGDRGARRRRLDGDTTLTFSSKCAASWPRHGDAIEGIYGRSGRRGGGRWGAVRVPASRRRRGCSSVAVSACAASCRRPHRRPRPRSRSSTAGHVVVAADVLATTDPSRSPTHWSVGRIAEPPRLVAPEGTDPAGRSRLPGTDRARRPGGDMDGDPGRLDGQVAQRDLLGSLALDLRGPGSSRPGRRGRRSTLHFPAMAHLIVSSPGGTAGAPLRAPRPTSTAIRRRRPRGPWGCPASSTPGACSPSRQRTEATGTTIPAGSQAAPGPGRRAPVYAGLSPAPPRRGRGGSVGVPTFGDRDDAGGHPRQHRRRGDSSTAAAQPAVGGAATRSSRARGIADGMRGLSLGAQVLVIGHAPGPASGRWASPHGGVPGLRAPGRGCGADAHDAAGVARVTVEQLGQHQRLAGGAGPATGRRGRGRRPRSAGAERVGDGSGHQVDDAVAAAQARRVALRCRRRTRCGTGSRSGVRAWRRGPSAPRTPTAERVVPGGVPSRRQLPVRTKESAPEAPLKLA